jgi:hypothetical protein
MVRKERKGVKESGWCWAEPTSKKVSVVLKSGRCLDGEDSTVGSERVDKGTGDENRRGRKEICGQSGR